MSKLQAYLCDNCKSIKEHDSIVGISALEDIYDKLKSYPIIYDPSKADIHLCTDCYRTQVTERAERMTDRKKSEYEYLKKVQELGFLLRNNTMTKWKSRK